MGNKISISHILDFDDVVSDIKRVLTEAKLDPSDITVEQYKKLGGKFDGRSLRKLGGFQSIIHEAFYSGTLRTSIRTKRQGAQFSRSLDSKIYIITAAQNATPVHVQVFKTLQVAAKHLNAELVVIPMRYKNPTSVWTNKQEHDEWWDDLVKPYLFNQRKKLNSNLVLAGDIKIQPTASSPLSGFEGLTGSESCILGHSKMQFKTVPVPAGKFPKILTTTGSCTVANYTDSRAGKLGAFHHFFGGIIVEIQHGKAFHIRQLNADKSDGSFIDKNKLYTVDGVSNAPPALGLVMGDTHVRVTDMEVDEATFGKNGIVETLNPQTLIWHDVCDSEVTNPHEAANPFIAVAKFKSARDDIKGEIEEVVEFINKRAKGRNAVIVDSNHHNFLQRWMIRTDWRQDLTNASFYLETAKAMVDSATVTKYGPEFSDPFQYWLKKLGTDSNIRCLNADESFKIANTECGLHGHYGPNGARGTRNNLSKIGVKVIIGHSHSPGIESGCYQVGTSTPRKQNYAHGPSSWLNTHCAIYANGKRALITIIDGTWTI